MKACIQRVISGKVVVNGEVVGEIGRGIVALVGFEKGDLTSYVDKMARKIVNLRIFEDDSGKMNLSLKDIGGELLLVPNFTLAADCRKGRRPSFQSSEEPSRAEDMFGRLVEACKEEGVPVKTGIFGADMKVHLINDGPVTFVLTNREL
ncbi:D-aminoacyl-tRNA deacylase [Thermovibrio sp.]